ncbi:Major facilitator superfamily domain general substrate transporter [Penicillium paradoxum]|uniref:Major facilitator superfamily domain general substrate transporter n=1 Tax=Penicillium paradoxum TaxID=176176 RepID=UPI0025477D64|nr:Major facilitator superfamily domain general substrate transporter [Penicillium paradoxum]KAJ5780138.1 Major facilitator superfamily domain general substrate transporter [Penicillium paradoxum]
MFTRWPTSQISRIKVENAANARSPSVFRLPRVDWRVVRTRKFIAHALSAALQSAAYYTPVFFFASFARTLGYSQTSSVNFIAISNATNAFGKTEHFSPGNAHLRHFCPGIMATIVLVEHSVYWEHSFTTFIIFYGVFASAYVALCPTGLVELFGVQNLVSVNGLLYMVRGFATLVRTPVADALIRGHNQQNIGPPSYENTSVMVDVLLVVATLAVVWAQLEAVLTLDGTQARRRKWLV